MRAWRLRRFACGGAAGLISSSTCRAPPLRLESGRSNQNLLQSPEQSLVLVARADCDPKPAGDRVTIVMADEDAPLAQRVRNRGRDVASRRPDEDEIGLRGRVLEAQLVELELQPAALGNDVVDDLAVG